MHSMIGPLLGRGKMAPHANQEGRLHMKLKLNPFPLIFEQGDTATKLWCLECLGLADSRWAHEWLLELIRAQRADGTFPSALDARQWGMRETVRNTLLLLVMGLSAEGANVAAAVRFVLEHPLAEGGWCENPGLDIPPFQQTFLSGRRGVTWLTADAVELLRQVGLGEGEVCQAAISWLRAQQNAWGGWPSVPPDEDEELPNRGDPDAMAQVTFLLGALFGVDDPQYRRGRELYEDFLNETAADAERGYRIRESDGSREDVEVYGLTHLLLSWLGDRPRRIHAGYDVHDRRVQSLMKALLACQADDGGWRPFWSDESSPLYAALAAKTLGLTGVVPMQDVRDMALGVLSGSIG